MSGMKNFKDVVDIKTDRFADCHLAQQLDGAPDIHDSINHDSSGIGKRESTHDESEQLSSVHTDKQNGIIAGGNSVGKYGTVNKLYDEEKLHARQGHGFAAERANTLYDRLQGKDAKVIGDDNAKNGADRIVDGIKIQSKYCQSGRACIDACFENGKFRYYDNGHPMQIEVPSDMYEAAVSAMEDRIRAGQIEGVKVEDARDIVRKGHFTYEQVKNIAKAGTVESLMYDAVDGAIIAGSAFGVTAVLTFATSLWSGEEYKAALQKATCTGIKVGGVSFLTTVLAGQLSKAGLNSALVNSSEAIVSLMGPKASALLINAFRNGSNIYGAAAMKSAAKLLRGNAITGIITVGVFSASDIANIFRGRISGQQLFKNITNTAATVAGGTGGGVGGAAVGAMVGGTIGGAVGSVVPGAGTAAGAAAGAMIGKVVGGLAGSVGGGILAGKAADGVVGKFIEDDAVEMVDIIQDVFGEMAQEYLLTKEEANLSVEMLGKKLDGKTLKYMYASEDRKAFARDLLQPVLESEISGRQRILMPSNEQIIEQVKNVLEMIYDEKQAG